MRGCDTRPALHSASRAGRKAPYSLLRSSLPSRKSSLRPGDAGLRYAPGAPFRFPGRPESSIFTPPFFLTQPQVKLAAGGCGAAIRARRSIPLPGQAGKLHIHSSVLPYPAASQACGRGMRGCDTRPAHHSASRAGRKAPYSLLRSSLPSRKSSLRPGDAGLRYAPGAPFRRILLICYISGLWPEIFCFQAPELVLQ